MASCKKGITYRNGATRYEIDAYGMKAHALKIPRGMNDEVEDWPYYGRAGVYVYVGGGFNMERDVYIGWLGTNVGGLTWDERGEDNETERRIRSRMKNSLDYTLFITMENKKWLADELPFIKLTLEYWLKREGFSVLSRVGDNCPIAIVSGDVMKVYELADCVMEIVMT